VNWGALEPAPEAVRLAGVAGPALAVALLGGCFSPAVAPGPDGTARAWTIQEPGDHLRILPGTPHAFDGVVAAIFLDFHSPGLKPSPSGE